jgi:hypothetical protein
LPPLPHLEFIWWRRGGCTPSSGDVGATPPGFVAQEAKSMRAPPSLLRGQLL